ncbi:MAG: P-loop NTPase [Candidatus Aenigmarchaeota archaeon]|nr:P-loop NTPase [Candidatus Aenigmarchaeota archaeon]
MARIIAVASGKGGVGKTTVVANLSAALAALGQSVVAVDSNITTSNLGIHLGIPMYPITIQDVLNGKARLKDAIYHHSSGFRVMPADISLEKLLIPDTNEFLEVFYKVTDADFLLVDTAAGLGKEALAAIEAADEVLVVTNPDLPAMTDALKLGRFAEEFGAITLGVVVNRYRGKGYDVPPLEVADFLGMPLLGLIPEDEQVKRALARKTPVVTHRPRSLASREFMLIASRLSGVPHRPPRRFWPF